MMNDTTKNQYNYPAGTIVKGKWHKQEYKLIKILGAGANGVVYLASGRAGYSAIKLSSDSVPITSEVNVLKGFAKVQGSALGPALHDVDDWDTVKGRVHFYAMEYIQGPELLAFVQKQGSVWASIMIIQLLDILDKLHQQQWIFGDLKPENMLVTQSPYQLRCVDVGGTTPAGRAIKEFTEFFDRGYWGMGTRKAEPSYDLFSTAMMMINLFYPKRFPKKEQGITQLAAAIHGHDELKRFERPLLKALKGEYKHAREMKADLLAVVSSASQRQTRSAQRSTDKRKAWEGVIETAAIVTITGILYAMYMYGHLF